MEYYTRSSTVEAEKACLLIDRHLSKRAAYIRSPYFRSGGDG